jgi:hypothetical protein
MEQEKTRVPHKIVITEVTDLNGDARCTFVGQPYLQEKQGHTIFL